MQEAWSSQLGGGVGAQPVVASASGEVVAHAEPPLQKNASSEQAVGEIVRLHVPAEQVSTVQLKPSSQSVLVVHGRPAPASPPVDPSLPTEPSPPIAPSPASPASRAESTAASDGRGASKGTPVSEATGMSAFAHEQPATPRPTPSAMNTTSGFLRIMPRTSFRDTDGRFAHGMRVGSRESRLSIAIP